MRWNYTNVVVIFSFLVLDEKFEPWALFPKLGLDVTSTTVAFLGLFITIRFDILFFRIIRFTNHFSFEMGPDDGHTISRTRIWRILSAKFESDFSKKRDNGDRIKRKMAEDVGFQRRCVNESVSIVYLLQYIWSTKIYLNVRGPGGDSIYKKHGCYVIN